jgi:hypothetical protein
LGRDFFGTILKPQIETVAGRVLGCQRGFLWLFGLGTISYNETGSSLKENPTVQKANQSIDPPTKEMDMNFDLCTSLPERSN